MSIFSASITGLNAAQIGLATTQNNIANASTPGYNRQVSVQVESQANATGSGFIGQGVSVSTVQRMYSQFLTTQVNQQQGQSSQLNTYYTQIQQINNMMASTTTGVAPALQNFFNAVNSVASSPNSMPARQTMIGTAQSLATTFQSLSQQLTSINSGVNGQITNAVSTINGIAKQIAALNQSIVVAQSSSGQPPNGLMDQRDQLVNQLNQQVGATVVRQTDGSYNVSIGTGQPLVVGSSAFNLNAVPSPTNPTAMEVAIGSTLIQPSTIQGGALGGVMAFQSQTLTQTQNMLGLVATGVAGTFNQQHALGQDLNGAAASLANSFFTDPAPVVGPNGLNNGTAVVTASITNFSNLTGSNYSLSYDGANYTVTRLSDNKVTTIPGAAVAGSGPATTIDMTNSDGLTINVPAGALPGDSFLIQPTINGASSMAVAVTDPSKIAAATPVITNASISNMGTATVSAGALDLTGSNVMASATAAVVPISFSTTPATFSVDGTVVTVNTDVTVAGTGSGAGTLTAAIQAGLSAAGLTSYAVSPAPGGGLQIVHTGSLAAVAISNVNDPSGNIVAGPGTAGPMYNAATIATLPATLTYNSATNTLSGFPANLPVTVTTIGSPPTTTSYPAPAGAVTYSNGATIDFGGLSFSISGAPVNGDTFTVAQNFSSTTDNRNALLLAGLQAKSTMQGGTTDYAGTYSQLVSQIGVQTSSLQVNSTAQTNLLNTTTASQQALSGVNLDEEAANLLRYQQAYQAAGKAMQVASTLFDTLLSLGR